MYDKLKQLLLEGLSGASRSALAHHRQFKETDKRRNRTLRLGDHPENASYASLVTKMHKHMAARDQAKQSIPTKRKRNNDRLRRDIKSLNREGSRSFTARVAKRSRKEDRKTQID